MGEFGIFPFLSLFVFNSFIYLFFLMRFAPVLTPCIAGGIRGRRSDLPVERRQVCPELWPTTERRHQRSEQKRPAGLSNGPWRPRFLETEETSACFRTRKDKEWWGRVLLEVLNTFQIEADLILLVYFFLLAWNCWTCRNKGNTGILPKENLILWWCFQDGTHNCSCLRSFQSDRKSVV